jgi:tetratricopeptide (TPR) repeat protein
MWCGSCHDPHSAPGSDQKVTWFRNKCLDCHAASTPCKTPLAVRNRTGNDCTGCHMPKNPVVDVNHASYTDHSIPRRLTPPSRQSTSTGVLTPLDRHGASDRDLGMAYALVVEGGRNPIYEARAFQLLKAAVERSPTDAPALVRLAQLYGYREDHAAATALYEKALQADPTQVVAAANLGVYRMQQGRANDAIRLWSDALKRSPGLETARMNLAVAQFRSGDAQSAQRTLVEGLDLNPGATAMRTLLNRYRRPQAP